MREKFLRILTGVIAMVATLAAPAAHAAGFAIFEQGGKAMGMGGAFTAQADDGSAMFHNVAGLGFQREGGVQVGASLIFLGDSSFEGRAPFPGPGVREEQENNLATPPHVYWVKPLGERTTLGLGLNSPFGLVTEWDDPDNFTGRFISQKAELRAVDLNAALGFQLSDTFAVGIGLIVRGSDVELRRRAAAVNPFKLQAEEVAKVRLESDVDTGVGGTIGILHRPNDWFSWGLSYRSTMEIDYSGTGRLTQQPTGDPVFDAVVAATLPFDQDLPIETTIEFPDQASLGLAFRLSENVLFESDINWTGWSSFDQLKIVFTSEPSLSSTRFENWNDVLNIRTGLAVDTSDRSQWRFGLYFDETPQPEQAVSPLLPDADRVGYSVGYGLRGERFTLDLYALLVDFRSRTTTTSQDNYHGTYRTDAFIVGATLGF